MILFHVCPKELLADNYSWETTAGWFTIIWALIAFPLHILSGNLAGLPDR